MDPSEFIIQRISEAIERLSPREWMNYIVTVALALTAILFGVANNGVGRNLIVIAMLLFVVVIVWTIPNQLEKKIATLLKIQAAVFLVRKGVDGLNETEMLCLLRTIGNIEVSNIWKTKELEELKVEALDLIKRAKVE